MNYPPIIKIDADDNILQFKEVIDQRKLPPLYVYRYIKSKTKLGEEVCLTEIQLQNFINKLYKMQN